MHPSPWSSEHPNDTPEPGRLYAVIESQTLDLTPALVGLSPKALHPAGTLPPEEIDAFLDRIEAAGRAGALPLGVSRNARRRWQESADLDSWVSWFSEACGSDGPTDRIYCDECGADLVDPEGWRGRAVVRCGFCDARWDIMVRDPAWWSCEPIESGRFARAPQGNGGEPARPPSAAPPSFDEEWATDWSIWVLDHGLPELPATVVPGQSVPVAYWAGPRFGGVLHVRWSWSRHHRDDQLQSEVEPFRRVERAWRPTGARGGSGWYDPPLARLDLGPREAFTGGMYTQNHATEGPMGICMIDGVAGTDGAWVEIATAAGEVRRPLDSPIGAFVAVTNLGRAATLRILDKEGATLLEQPFGGSR